MKRKIVILLAAVLILPGTVQAAQLLAGAAKVDITDERGPVNDRLYARALALRSDGTTAFWFPLTRWLLVELAGLRMIFYPTFVQS